MPQTLEDIFNLALSACGSTSTVGSADERSREAQTCRLWFPVVRDNLQAVAPWPCVNASQRLARLATSSVPWQNGESEPGFQYSFSLPSNLLLPRFLNSYRPFTLGFNGSEKIISTSEENPILQYNARNENIGTWDHPLIMATIYVLATHIARPITGRSTTVGENKQLADEIVSAMLTSVANAGDKQMEAIPSWISARGYSNPSSDYYIVPFQSINYGAAV